MDRRPGPAWAYYSGVALLVGTLFWLAEQVAGLTPPGTFHLQPFIFGFYLSYVVGLVHYLGRQAASALEAFHPGLAVSDSEYARIPTWPWEPGALRGLVAALLLPVVIWLIQFFLGRWRAA